MRGTEVRCRDHSNGSSPRVRGTVANSACGSSPRVRGTGVRSIAARAGNRCASCGDGSSPRVRGTATTHSSPRNCRLIRRSVHPRVCGEQRINGSSVNAQPVHPRVCGEQSVPGPAPANATLLAAAVHPRVCGEQILRTVSRNQSQFGSSPRVRGTDQTLALIWSLMRFIPACAGNTDRRAVHPRVCGEQSRIACFTQIYEYGSSPRVRGTGLVSICQPMSHCAGSSPRVRGTGFGCSTEDRFIPACAGNSVTTVARANNRFIPACAGNSGAASAPDAVHPRVCGEQ